MRNAGLDEAQVGIKIAGRKISITSDMPGESQGWGPGGLPSMGLHRMGHD